MGSRDIEDRLEGFGKPLKQYTFSLNGHGPFDPFDLEDRLEGSERPPRLTAQDRELRVAVEPVITAPARMPLRRAYEMEADAQIGLTDAISEDLGR